MRNKTAKRYRTSPDPKTYLLDTIAVDAATGCWNWTGSCFQGRGYGYFKNKHLNGGKAMAASRAAWLIFKGGTLGRWDFVCHRCDNNPCCNPDHLFLGTGVDNMQDCVRKGRINRGEDRPQAKLTEEKVRMMRRLRQQGVAWRKLAAQFGMGLNPTRSAITGKTWAHVDEPIPTYVGRSGRPY